jgi:hypothetical protein
MEIFMQSMTKRERVLTAFSRKTPDKVPKWTQPGSYLSQIVKEHTGSDNPARYFDMDIQQFVYYAPTKNQGDFSKYPHRDQLNGLKWKTLLI